MNQSDLSQRLRRLFARDTADQFLSSERPSRPHALDEARLGKLDAWVCNDTLFAFDFDGTLAPLVDDPDRSCVPADTRDALDALADCFCVAVISGRSRASLLERLPPSLSYVVGNHGNEGLPGSLAAPLDDRRICANWVGQLQADTPNASIPNGAVIENKGATLSLHYRHCDHPLLASIELARRAHGLTPTPRVIPGVLVHNLLPPTARTKREALVALLRHSRCSHAVFVGDDASDEAVFANAPEHWLTIGVSHPDETDARCFVRNPKEVGVFIEVMVARRRHRQLGT